MPYPLLVVGNRIFWFIDNLLIRKLYDLPSLQMKDTFHYLFDDVKRSFTEKIEYLTPNMFVINNYEYHPKIDYPLSN